MPQARIWGISVQEMISGARETLIGVNRDPQFGHLIVFGLGGIYVEVLKDVSFRVAPVSVQEANKMITELRSYALLRGVRGQAPADVDAIVETILRISQLVTDFPDIIEMDINPFMVLDKGKGGVAADVRITIGE
jgi:acetyltransferase